MSCRTFDTERNQSLCISNYYINYNPYNQNDYSGTLMSEKNQIILDIPSYDYTVMVSVGPDGGGTVSGGGLCYYNQPITLTATPDTGYIFSNWTKNGEVVSYLSSYELTVTETAEYVANFELAPAGIVIGNATYTNSYLPSYSTYPFTLSEQIYTTNEMGGDACEISSVSFFNTGSYSISRNLGIYMVNTDKTSFVSSTDWIAVTESDQVFSGNVTLAAHGWTTIYFNTAFAYDGLSNVALILDDHTNNWDYGLSCRTFDSDVTQAIRINGYDSVYNPTNPSSYIGTLMMEKNQVIFGIPSFDYTVNVTANPANCGTVSGGGLYYLNQTITLTATANEGYVFNNWTKNGEVVSYLSKYTLSVTESAEYVANFQEVTNGFVIGEATSTNKYLPTYYYYSLTEQIYTSAEMGDDPCQISSVSFFNTGTSNRTRNMNIYMVSTDKTSFEGTSDWIPVSDDDLVFSGRVTFSVHDWATVYFSTPFNYNGSSNVALIVDDNSNSYNTYTSFRTFDTEMSQALRIYGSGINYDPYVPSEYTGSLLSTKNQIIFGIPSYDFTVTVSANPEESGLVSVNDNIYYYGQTCTVTATPNEGYCFANWTENGNVVSFDANYSFIVTRQSYLIAHFVSDGNIDFADANVKALCVASWDTNSDGELSYVEAASVTSLGEVFRGNAEIVSFEELQYFIGLTSISNNAFRDCSSLVELPSLPNTITSIGNYAFYGCSGATGSLIIPDAVISIGNSAYYGCQNLNGSLTLPKSLISIGSSAFFWCQGLTGSLIIPNTVTTIGSMAFYDCRSLTGSLVIPNTLSSISSAAFYWCNGLTSLTIPESITLIRESAFSNCRNLTSIIILAETPPTVYSGTFHNCPKSIPVYVPCGSVTAYQSAAYWSQFTNIQELCTQSQAITLTEGWNWFSANVDITLDDLENALIEALPGTTITIKSQTQNIKYQNGRWTGSLTTLDKTRMYMISVENDCEITLEGVPIDPSNLTVTIDNGANWLAFPYDASMTVTDFFGSFPVNNDMVKSQSQNARYQGNRWGGQLGTLVPGKGYLYISNTPRSRTFTFPASAK